jgi:hypothetical protein
VGVAGCFELCGGEGGASGAKEKKMSMFKNCSECGGCMMSANAGSVCFSCRELGNDDGEVTHHDLVRCPHCKHLHSVSKDLDGEGFDEDDNEITCHECNKDFTFRTSISYSFESPALASEDD